MFNFMNKDLIINEYQEGNKDESSLLLEDGRTVVGEVVDEGNYLYYVTKDKDNQYDLVFAHDVTVTEVIKDIINTDINTSSISK